MTSLFITRTGWMINRMFAADGKTTSPGPWSSSPHLHASFFERVVHRRLSKVEFLGNALGTPAL